MARSLNLDPFAPTLLFEASVSDKTKAKNLRNTAEDHIKREITLAIGNALTPNLLAAIPYMPGLVSALGVAIFDYPDIIKVISTSPHLAAILTATQYQAACRLTEDILLNDPEGLYHFCVAAETTTLSSKVDLSPYHLRLGEFPFWAARFVHLFPNRMKVVRVILPPNPQNPYQLLHMLLENEAANCARSWEALVADPTVLVLAAKWLGSRGFPWEFLPISKLSPRDAFNLLGIWPTNLHPSPYSLWEQVATDPEWLAAAWAIPSVHRPKGNARIGLLRYCERTLEAAHYPFCPVFVTWWKKHAQEMATSSSGSDPRSDRIAD